MKLRYHQLAKELGVEPEALTAAAAKQFALEKEPEAVEAWLRETFTAKEGPALPEGEERVPVPGVIGEVNELTSEALPELEPATPEEIAVLEELAASSLAADAEAFAEEAAEQALDSVGSGGITGANAWRTRWAGAEYDMHDGSGSFTVTAPEVE